MKNFLKRFSLVLSLIMFGILLVRPNITFAEELSTDLVKLDYTIDEIRQMSLGEYYSKIFPETFDEFTEEEQEQLFNTPYLSNKTRAAVEFGPGLASSFLTKTATNRFKYDVTTHLKFSDGSKAKKIHHSSVLTDKNGTTWMIRTDTKENTNFFNMSGYKDVTSGQYYLETVHTVTAPSGYYPKTASTVSGSGWTSSN